MTDPRSNLPPADGASGSKPLGEEQLLAWIDGQLPQSEVVRLEASSGRAGLSERVRQIQANRRALRSLPLDKAPPELLGRVMQALEREQLLTDSGSAPLAGDSADGMVRELDPISIVEYREQNPPRAWMPRLAMAAGVALLLGGAAYWAMLLASPATPVNPDTPGTPGMRIGPLATNDTAPGLAAPAIAGKLEGDAGELAIASTMEGASASQALRAEAVSEPVASVTQVASAAEGLALAAEGRLVLRVLARTASMSSGNEWSAGSRRRELSDASAGWALSRDVPADVAITVLASKAAGAIAGPMPELVGPPLPEDRFAAVATRRALASFMGPRGAFSALAPERQAALGQIESTMLLRVNASEESLEAARAALERELDADVTLERLSVGVTIPEAIDPAQVLWWTRSSTTWAPSLRIPVVVERVGVQ